MEWKHVEIVDHSMVNDQRRPSTRQVSQSFRRPVNSVAHYSIKKVLGYEEL